MPSGFMRGFERWRLLFRGEMDEGWKEGTLLGAYTTPCGKTRLIRVSKSEISGCAKSEDLEMGCASPKGLAKLAKQRTAV